MKFTVATSSSQRRTSTTLKLPGLRVLHIALVCNDAVANGKPAPTSTKKAAQVLGGAPARCIALELPDGDPVGHRAGLAGDDPDLVQPDAELKNAVSKFYPPRGRPVFESETTVTPAAHPWRGSQARNGMTDKPSARAIYPRSPRRRNPLLWHGNLWLTNDPKPWPKRCAALRFGYRLFDCASVYGNEDRIGRAWKRKYRPARYAGTPSFSFPRCGTTCTGKATSYSHSPKRSGISARLY